MRRLLSPFFIGNYLIMNSLCTPCLAEDVRFVIKVSISIFPWTGISGNSLVDCNCTRRGCFQLNSCHENRLRFFRPFICSSSNDILQKDPILERIENRPDICIGSCISHCDLQLRIIAYDTENFDFPSSNEARPRDNYPLATIREEQDGMKTNGVNDTIAIIMSETVVFTEK